MRIHLTILLILFAFLGTQAQKYNKELLELYSKKNYTELENKCAALLKTNPKRISAWQYLTLCYNDQYKYMEVKDTYQKALKHFPENRNFKYQLAVVTEKLGNENQAVALWNEIFEQDSTHMPTLHQLATYYRGEQNYFKAIGFYNRMVQIDSLNPVFWSGLAYCCDKNSLIEPAIAYYGNALFINPDDAVSTKRLANIYLDYKSYTIADSLVNAYLNRNPNDIKMISFSAYVLGLEGRYLESIEVFKKAIQKGDSTPFTCKYYGQCLYNNGNYEEAAIWLKKYLKTTKKSPAQMYILALALHKSYQYEKSIKEFNKLLEEMYNPKQITKIYCNLADCHADYAKYLEHRSDSLQRHKKHYQEAIDNFVTASDKFTDYPDALYALAQLYDTDLHNEKMALYYFERYYQKADLKNMSDYKFNYLKKRIAQLKEEVHFIGNE
jgi:tetratricopeptide (TPR) repeat protein